MERISENNSCLTDLKVQNESVNSKLKVLLE